MRNRSTFSRALALAGLVLVPWGVMGYGVHDPDCPHHRPDAVGPAHLAHGASGHAGHTASPGHGTSGPAEHGNPGGGEPSDDEGCHCFGVCVPGVQAVLPSLQPITFGLAVFPDSHVRRELPPVVAPTVSVAEHLPPATGPPAVA